MGHHASHGLCQTEGVDARVLGSDNSAGAAPVQEQAAPADVEMAVEETEETAMEEPEEGDVLGDAQVLFGNDEKDLMQGK